MKKWIIAIIILVISVIGYAYIGGFNKVVIKEHQSHTVTLQGKLYKGSAKKGMGAIFDEVDVALKGVDSKEVLSAYFYKQVTKKENFDVEVFIGATYTGGEKIAESFEVKEFKLDKCLSAQHKTNVPLFSKVYRTLFADAEERKIKLDSSIVLEQYPSGDSLIIWVPVND